MTVNPRVTQSTLPVPDPAENAVFLERIPPIIFPIGLAILTFVLYIGSLGGDFLPISDDGRYILEHEAIHSISLDNFGDIWTSHYQGEYIPLTHLSWMLNYAISGTEPLGYHIVNVILHSLNVILVYSSLSIIQNRRLIAVLGAALFAVHPLQVESVAWISQRKILLSSLFILLALYLHIFSLRKKGRDWATIVAWVCFGLALLAHQKVVLAPIVFLGMDLMWTKRKFSNIAVRNVGYWVLGVIGFVISVLAFQAGESQTADVGGPLNYIQLFLQSVGDYFLTFVLPFNLNNLYIYDLESLSIGEILTMLLGVGLLIGSIGVAILQPFGKPFSRWAVLWIWVFLVPSFNFYYASIIRADRMMYLPSVMLCALVSMGLFKVADRLTRPELRSGVVAIAGGVMTLFLVLSLFRMGVWQNEEELWLNHVEDYPNSLAGWQNLGSYYAATGNFSAAAQSYQNLANSHPNYAVGNSLRAAIAMIQEDYSTAATYYNAAYQLEPDNVDYRNSLGIAFLQAGVIAFESGNYENALGLYVEANKYIPDVPELHNNIGFTFYATGQFEEALVAYNRAIELNPNYARAWVNVGDAALNLSQYQLAANAYNNALNLGAVLNARSASNFCLSLGELQAEVQRAVSFCEQALDMEPNNALYWGRSAHVLLLFGLNQDALSVATRAVELDPNLALNQRVLGDALALTGNIDGARLAYQTALQINPGSERASVGLAALDAGQLPNPRADFSNPVNANPQTTP